MKPIRPYYVTVYNRITDYAFAQFYTNQVPSKGEQISVFANYRDENDPFHLWGRWVVDQVTWTVASSASPTAFEVARQCEGDMTASYCQEVELYVWPAEGPHWTETPRFAKVLSPDDEDDEDDEDG